MNAAAIFVVIKLKSRLVKTSNVPVLFQRDNQSYIGNIYIKKIKHKTIFGA